MTSEGRNGHQVSLQLYPCGVSRTNPTGGDPSPSAPHALNGPASFFSRLMPFDRRASSSANCSRRPLAPAQNVLSKRWLGIGSPAGTVAIKSEQVAR